LNAVIVFVKNPVLGKVKTRLALSTSAEYALRVYSALLVHTQQILIPLEADLRVYYSDQVEADAGWRTERCTQHVQRGSDLGERLHNAFQETIEQGYDKVVVIGSDCLELTTAHLVSSFDVLTHNEVVIGPTFDGGYYLLGMKQFYPQLFADKAWSTPEVYAQTLRDVNHSALRWQALAFLHDIDTFEDVKQTYLRDL